MKYTRKDIEKIVDLAFRGAARDETLKRELNLNNYRIKQRKILFQRTDVLQGLEILFNAIYPQLDKKDPPAMHAAERIPLETLGLSTRCYTALFRNGVCTVADLLRLTEDDIRRARGVGAKCAAEIREKREAFIEEFEKKFAP